MLAMIQNLFGPREYKRLIFEQSKRRWDKWETADSDGYELYLRIYTVKRKGERGFYQIEVPNYSICTHRLLHGLWEIMLHIDGSGPAISRLDDHYDKLAANYRKVSDVRQSEIQNATIPSSLYAELNNMRRSAASELLNGSKGEKITEGSGESL